MSKGIPVREVLITGALSDDVIADIQAAEYGQAPKTFDAKLTPRVLVILDPGFGERLLEVAAGQAVWIADSATNTPVVKSLWASRPGETHLTGITTFKVSCDDSPATAFLDQLGQIDLHHGPYSSDAPYRVLEVVGVALTSDIEASLKDLGFDGYQPIQLGFIASRSEAEANRLRE